MELFQQTKSQGERERELLENFEILNSMDVLQYHVHSPSKHNKSLLCQPHDLQRAFEEPIIKSSSSQCETYMGMWQDPASWSQYPDTIQIIPQGTFHCILCMLFGIVCRFYGENWCMQYFRN